MTKTAIGIDPYGGFCGAEGNRRTLRVLLPNPRHTKEKTATGINPYGGFCGAEGI